MFYVNYRKSSTILKVIACALASLVLSPTVVSAQQSVARQFNEALLNAIRIDKPAPTVHSRNLYHTSASMWDAYATYGTVERGTFFLEKHTAPDISTARNEAISYAAYRVLSERYTCAVDSNSSQVFFDNVMANNGYDIGITTTVGNTPAAIGNRIAQTILQANLNDGANEANCFVDNTGYAPSNPSMIVDYANVVDSAGTPLRTPNQWQPLFLSSNIQQNGIPAGSQLQVYVGPHWGSVETFAMGKTGSNPGPYSWSSIDPGMPPQFGGASDAQYKADTLDLINLSYHLDPTQGPGAQTINISPNNYGNRPLGTHNDQGWAVNPSTGQPYADNFVLQADYSRVLAEFWADGPDSETPPGHWNTLANYVSDHPQIVKQIGGIGAVVSDLEWDVKLYLALNGAVHDAAVGAWGSKRQYDYVRPITKIRYQGSLGQSSDPLGTSYHPDGLPLIPGQIEMTTAASVAPGGVHRNVYDNANQDADGNFVEFFTEAELVDKVVVQAWNHEPEDPSVDFSGIDWILAENWVPYQRDNFVTPPFAAYISGHSTFSRAAAEVLSLYTGSEYFPGGLGEATFLQDDFLVFETGPTTDVTLQWAKYFDAADEAGISRLWGGIHVPADDFAGRIMGSYVGLNAYAHAQHFFVPEPSSLVLISIGSLTFLGWSWRQRKQRLRKKVGAA